MPDNAAVSIVQDDEELEVFMCSGCGGHLWMITAETPSRPICATCGWIPEPQEGQQDGISRNDH